MVCTFAAARGRNQPGPLCLPRKLAARSDRSKRHCLPMHVTDRETRASGIRASTTSDAQRVVGGVTIMAGVRGACLPIILRLRLRPPTFSYLNDDRQLRVVDEAHQRAPIPKAVGGDPNNARGRVSGSITPQTITAPPGAPSLLAGAPHAAGRHWALPATTSAWRGLHWSR